MPAGAVHQHDAMAVPGNVQADLLEMQLHRFGVGGRQHQGRTLAMHRADRAEDVGALIALIRRQARPRPLPGPDPGPSVLLAQPGLVLEPNLDPPVLGQMAYVRPERAGEVFLNASIVSGFCAGCCGRPVMREKDCRASRSPMPRSE